MKFLSALFLLSLVAFGAAEPDGKGERILPPHVGNTDSATNVQNPGISQGLKKGPYGPKGWKLDDLVKDEPEEIENAEQKEVRKYVKSYMKWTLENGYEPTADFQRTDDYTCKFVGDTKRYPEEYCVTMFEVVRPTNEFAVATTLRRVEVKGSTAYVHVNVRTSGKIPLLGSEISVSASFIGTVRYEDGMWKYAKIDYIDDASKGVFPEFRRLTMTLLRDSIYSTKQTYPTYNPLVLVGGSAVAGIFGIIIVWGFIMKRRRSYKQIQTVAEV